MPQGRNHFADVTFIHSFQTFQIPNDVAHGEPASTDDSEKQEDTFFSVQSRHALGNSGTFSIGPALKLSRIRDFGDPANDLAYGERYNVAPPLFGNGGRASDCANALKTGNFSPTTCAFSLRDDKTAVDGLVQAAFVRQYGLHDFRAGVLSDLTRVSKDYAVTLQPNNFLAPILTPAAPHAAVTVTDDEPNSANTYGAYLQDSWRLSRAYQLDYGLRYDFFTIKSAGFPKDSAPSAPD